MIDQIEVKTVLDLKTVNPDEAPLIVIDNVSPAVKEGKHYFRSRISSRVGVNPLVAASAAIFALCKKMREDVPEDLHGLYQEFIHEIRAFETNAKKAGYPFETILIARYLLCALLDEVVENTSIGEKWQPYRMSRVFHREENIGERFFLILEKIKQAPQRFIELLELIYLCMSNGFEGKCLDNENNHQAITQCLSEIYHRIRSIRGHKPSRLFVGKAYQARLRVIPQASMFSIWRVLLITGTFLASMYAGMGVVLNQSASTGYDALASMSSMAQGSVDV